MPLHRIVAFVARLVPAATRARCFEPAAADVLRVHRVRARRARSAPGRAALAVWTSMALLRLAMECRAIDGPGRRAFNDSEPKGWHPMIAQDVRYAARLLRRAPGFTTTAVLVIALGVGATTALFSIVERVVLRPLPYPEQSRVMDVNEIRDGHPFAVSAVNLQDWRARNHSFLSLAAYNSSSVTIGTTPPERADGVLADPALFDALGVPPLLGRSLEPADAKAGAARVAVISERLWRRRFAGDRELIGRLVSLDGEPRAIVGVMPSAFDFPEGTEVWLPLILTPDDLAPRQRGAHYLSVVGRLRPGVTLAQANEDLESIERDLAHRFPRQVSEYAVAVTPLLDAIVSDVKRPLLVLLGAVAFVLLIAAMNVSNLLLVRATARTGEIAIRSAVGAGRWQILRQLCVESIVLSLAGGGAGVLLASWALRLLVAISPADLPRAAGVSLSAPILLFALALSILTGVVFGLVPALIGSRANLSAFLKDGRRGADAGGTRRSLRHVLVGVQVALAVILLTGAGLALRSFDRLTNVDPGFDAANVLTFNLQLPDGSYPTSEKDAAFFREYTQRLQQQPGILAAGAVLFPPLAPLGFGGTVTFPGRTGSAAEGRMQVRSVTPGYFDALRIPLRAGRLPAWTDARGGPGVVVISDAAARTYWPGENPVGQPLWIRVSMGVLEQPRQIVGIVGDVHVGGLETEPPAVAYVPQDQYATNEMTMVVRTPDDPSSALPIARTLLAQMDPSIAISRVRPMRELTARAVAAPRFRMLLLAAFALASLVLAAIGIYGTLAYSVTQRRNEIGLRIALGARASAIMRMVAREGLLPVAAGLVAGLIGAGMLTRVMQALLFGVSPLDPATFAAVAGVLGVVSAAACYLPTRRAVAVDPVSSLRA